MLLETDKDTRIEMRMFLHISTCIFNISYKHEYCFLNFYRRTVHFELYVFHTPTKALFINLVKSFYLY